MILSLLENYPGEMNMMDCKTERLEILKLHEMMRFRRGNVKSLESGKTLSSLFQLANLSFWSNMFFKSQKEMFAKRNQSFQPTSNHIFHLIGLMFS